jgi:hypothetical protein
MVSCYNHYPAPGNKFVMGATVVKIPFSGKTGNTVIPPAMSIPALAPDYVSNGPFNNTAGILILG